LGETPFLDEVITCHDGFLRKISLGGCDSTWIENACYRAKGEISGIGRKLPITTARLQPIAATPQQLQSGKSYLPQTAPNADRLIVTHWIKASTE